MSIRPKQQGAFQGGLSGTAPGPQRAQSRATTQRARTLGVPAGSGHIAKLRYYSEYFQHSAYMPTTPRAEPCPSYSGRRRACAGTSSALSHRPCSLPARASSRETHLERHDRLADHREQPRRQRDQPRRELVVRHTGGDRRRRLPVPREQHRHEQLEPLQRTHSVIQPRSRPRAARGKARSADGGSASLAACCPVWTQMAVNRNRTPKPETPVAVSPRVCREYPSSTRGGFGIPQDPRPTWQPQCTRTAKRSGRLATASSACQTGRGGETARPGKQAPGKKMAV